MFLHSKFIVPTQNIRLYTKYVRDIKSSSFRQGLPESSHRDVNLWVYTSAQSSTCAAAKLPSMALDSGIHAGMTVLLPLDRTCI
ncbi:MAG: hypothetical protein ACXWTS_02400 [Methylococcaceae bacterium]